MKNKLFAALGFFAAITAFASPVYAQSRVNTNSQNEGTTLSGASLRTIDNRTAEEDFTIFFAEDNPANISLNDVSENDNVTAPNVDIIQVRDMMEIPVNQRIPTADAPIIYRADRASENVDRVQVQIELGE